MSNYKEKFKDPRWQKKRLEILNRDQWRCLECWSEEKTLNVHHLIYLRGADPWEAHDGFLLTLCEDCHKDILKYEYDKKEDSLEYSNLLDSIALLLNTLLKRSFDWEDIRTLAEEIYDGKSSS